MSAQQTCYLHTRTPATLSCEVCDRPICNRCVQNDQTRLTCPACLDGARTGRAAGTALRVLVAAALLVGLGGVGWVVLSGSGDADEAAAPEGSTKRYAAARLAATRDPDNPDRWLRLAEILLEENKLALAEEPLRKALALAPDDPEINARMGFYHYERGDVGAARKALEKAQLMGSADPNVEAILTAIGEARAADEQAEAEARARAREAQARAIEAVEAEVEARKAAAQARRDEAERLAEEARAEAAEAAQRRIEADGCAVDSRRLGSVTVITATVNGIELDMLFDTGASGVLLSAEAAARVEVEIDPSRRIRAQTANGITEQRAGHVERIEVGGRATARHAVAVCVEGEPCLGARFDGLLGVSAHRALGLALDPTSGQVRLLDCQ